MQSVNEKWYSGYRWGMLVTAVLLLLFAAVAWISPQLLPLGARLHISYFTGVVALLQIIFLVAIYERLAAKTSPWEAMLSSAMIQATVIFSLIQTTGRLDSIFMIWWGIVIFLSGMFGMYGSAGTAFVSAIYFVLVTTDAGGNTSYTTRGVVTFAILLLVAGLSQLFWRKRYSNQDSAQVAKLSGQLKNNKQQSEILVQSLTDGVILLGTDGQISLMNPAAATMTGWNVADGIGTDYRSVVTFKNEDGSDIEPTENPLSKVFQDQVPTTKTLQLLSRDGKPIIISLVTSAIVDPKSKELTGVVVVMRDISISHQSDKQRGEFISTASHEMRTPVAAIEGYLQLALNDKVATIDPKARNFLEKALDSTHHLGELFQDLLTSAKAEDGRLVSHPSVVELGAYLEELAETFKFSADKKGLLTDFIFGSNAQAVGAQAGEHVVRPLFYVHVDPDRLREVITNLFDNAVKYTPSGKISVGLTGNNEVVQLFVRDTGPGIPPEDVPHLFQKFYRVDNSATRTIGGTGLGLFICKKIIEIYKGRIWAESTVGKGSTFYINLPRLTAQRAEELQRAEAQGTESQPISSLTTPV